MYYLCNGAAKFLVGSLVSDTNCKRVIKTTVFSPWQVNSKVLTGDIAVQASWIKKVHLNYILASHAVVFRGLVLLPPHESPKYESPKNDCMGG